MTAIKPMMKPSLITRLLENQENDIAGDEPADLSRLARTDIEY
jgi:hypothetical protein